MHGSAGALWLILMRVGQGVGGALIFANSSAILTDAFPQDQRGRDLLARPFATGGMMLAATSFLLLIVLPVDFSYVWFALILVLNGSEWGCSRRPTAPA